MYCVVYRARKYIHRTHPHIHHICHTVITAIVQHVFSMTFIIRFTNSYSVRLKPYYTNKLNACLPFSPRRRCEFISNVDFTIFAHTQWHISIFGNFLNARCARGARHMLANSLMCVQIHFKINVSIEVEISKNGTRKIKIS